MFLWYQIDLSLQFPRSLKFKPNSSPYTHDYPNTLLFETQGKVFEKNLNFVVDQTQMIFSNWSITTCYNLGI